MDNLRVTAAHALSVYAEPLAVGRRVLVVGDATEGLGERLAQLGARLVHVYDPDANRAARAQQNASRTLAIRPLPAGELEVRDGAFDLVLVPDLGAIADPSSLVTRLRRVVAADGAALFAARNPEAFGGAGGGIDYYELYDLVSMQFATVRMIGQMPFTGVTLAELGEAEEEPQVSVETQLVEGGGTPHVFIALASQRDVRLDPYSIVQLPPESVLGAGAADAERERVQMELAEARLRAELLEAQLEEQRTQIARLTSEGGPRAAELEDARAELAQAAAKLKEVEARAGDNHVRAERLTHEIRKLEEELERQRERNFRLTRDVEEEKKARQKAELELGMVRKNPELAEARNRVSYLEEALRASEEVVTALRARVVELEAGLDAAKAIASRVAELEAALAERTQESVVLVAELEQLRSAPQAGVTPEELAALVQRAERAESVNAALEQELSQIAEAHTSELSQLEQVLRERAHKLQALEAEIARRERLVQELVARLEEAQIAEAQIAGRAEPPGEERPSEKEPSALAKENEELRTKLDALALEVARREADVQSATWRVAELEQALAARDAAAEQQRAEAERESAARLTAALEELDVLRRALAQEHEERKRLESLASKGGDEPEGELARARTELQRQATIIEQLSRELEGRSRNHTAELREDAAGLK